MIDIPPEVRIKGGIKTGTVYFFKEESHGENAPEHHFVVINADPISSSTAVMVYGTSKVEKVKWKRRVLPETLVEIAPGEYQNMPFATIFDCNEVIRKSIDELVSRLTIGKLGAYNPTMNSRIVERLIAATKASPLVEEYVKEML